MAERSTIELEIVTPKGRALLVTCEEVRAPSVNGEFGVLPGHLPMLAALRIGLVSYRTGTNETTVAIGAGFAEVGPSKVGILTDDCVTRDKVDPVLLRTELSRIQHDIERAAEEMETDAARQEERRILAQKENWVAAQLELYGESPPATMHLPEDYASAPRDEDVLTPDEKPTEK